MKCVQIEFPIECTQQISSYKNKQSFQQMIKNHCDEMFGDPSAFIYAFTQNQQSTIHTWKCTECQAFLMYGQEDRELFTLRDLLTTHTHPLKTFQNCNTDLLDNHIKPKDFWVKEEFFQTYKIIVGQQVDGLKNMLKTQWQKQFPHRPVPRLESSLVHNHIYITCRQYRQRLRPKCPFKIIYKKLNESPYLYQLQYPLQLCHSHLLTYYKQIKPNQNEEKKGKKKQGHQDKLKEYLFDCEIGESMRDIFTNLRAFIQETKHIGFQILVNTPDTPKQKKPDEVQEHNDEQDYFILTNKTCKFLYRNYANTLVITRLALHQFEPAQITYAGFSFQGFNFKSHNVYFGLALCQNPNLTKIKGIIQLFFNYFEHKQHLIIIPQNQRDLYEVLLELKAEKKNFNIHRYYNKKQFHCDIIETQIAEITKYLNDIKNYSPQLNHPKFDYVKVGFQKNYFYGLTDIPTPFHHRVQKGSVLTKANKLEKSSAMTSNDNIFRAGTNLKNLAEYINQKNKCWKLIQRERDICYQKYYEFPTIRRWRMIMSKKSFLALINQFEKMHSCSIQISKPPHFYIIDHQGYPFIVSNTIQSLTWNCQCGYKNRTGIPCCHLIRVLISEKQPLLKSVNKFWVIDEGLMNVLTPFSAIKRKARGRSKLTFLNHVNK